MTIHYEVNKTQSYFVCGQKKSCISENRNATFLPIKTALKLFLQNRHY
jgi:hypothetical protein